MPSRHVGAAIAATAITVLLATGAAADAATRTVHAGAPTAQAAALPEGAIGEHRQAGDKVAFKIGGLHNVLFAPRGTTPGRFHAPDPARPVAAGAWFDGRPGWFLDPTHLVPAGDKVIDGKGLDGSGIFTGQGAPPDYVVSFPKTGSYSYLCTVHPGMKGKVRVVRKGAPSKAKHGKAIARQLAATVKSAKRLAAQAPAGLCSPTKSDQ